MQFLETFVLPPRVGTGGVAVNEDKSGNLQDMKYAEKLVLNPEFLGHLAQLKGVAIEKKTADGIEITGGTLLLTKDDILKYRDNGDDIKVSSAAQKVIQVFVALKIPFFAVPYTSKEVKAVEKTKQRGENKGQVYRHREPDMLRIYRNSEVYDENKYNSDESDKVKEGGHSYHKPTVGIKLRTAQWLKENGAPLIETLKAVGVDFEVR